MSSSEKNIEFSFPEFSWILWLTKWHELCHERDPRPDQELDNTVVWMQMSMFTRCVQVDTSYMLDDVVSHCIIIIILSYWRSQHGYHASCLVSHCCRDEHSTWSPLTPGPWSLWSQPPVCKLLLMIKLLTISSVLMMIPQATELIIMWEAWPYETRTICSIFYRYYLISV